MSEFKKVSLRSLNGYSEVSYWDNYMKAFLDGVLYKWKHYTYTKAQLFKNEKIQKLIREMPYNITVDPIMYLISIGEIEIYTLEDFINHYPTTLCYIIDNDRNYKGCIFMVDGMVDLTPEEKASMTAEELSDYEDAQMQCWDWTSFEIYVNTYTKSIVSLGMKYESLCYDLDESLCFCIDQIASRMYQKAVATNETIKTANEDEVEKTKEATLDIQNKVHLILTDENEKKSSVSFR
jgi:hypothetical protein